MKKVVLILLLMISVIAMGSQASAAEPLFDYEPNDSPDTAYEVYNNSEVISTISTKSDVDYYKFYVRGTAEIVISLTSPKGLDYDIKLYNENYKEIAGSKQPMGETDTIYKNSLSAGTYSIKVYSFKKTYSDSPYNLSIKINDSNIPDKPYAGISEANNVNTTMANALEVNKNTSFRARVSAMNESRYYKFTLENVSDVDISMIPPKGTDLDIKLYNWYGLEVGSSTNKDGSESIREKRLYPGTYYLKVYGHNYAFSSDTFEIYIKSEKSPLKPNNSESGNKEIVDDSSVVKEAAPISQTSKSAPKALLLYVGLDLPHFTTPDIKKMLIDDPINTKEFIILDNGAQYNTYLDSNGELVDIVTPEKIDALTKDKVDSTGLLDSIKQDYKNLYNKLNRNRSLNFFANDVFDLALKLIRVDPEVKITIAIPGTEFHALSEEFIEPVKEILIRKLKERFDEVNPDYWKNNIRGYYFSTEGVPYYYTWFNPNKTIDFGNPIVKTMISFSNEIHQVFNKEFIWIPYYGSSLKKDYYYNKDQAVRIGYIANRTNIFDYVIVQPSYYFKADHKNNISLVQNSSKSNMVLDINNDIVGGIKTSKTLIGAEMEIDSRYNTMSGYTYNGYKNRYSEYVKAFSALDKETPIAFYAGNKDEIFTDEVYQAIKSFFGSIKK
ncbi:MAG TPA: hypothetical protein PK566_16880 [Pseudobacteroides sp.]|mgnify:CR=1 FL=1|nr:hypothetical protein [Pseudobacteroides sp.]